MNKIKKLMGRFSSRLGFEEDMTIGIPKVTMLGSNELEIENHKGIIEYSQEKIRIRTEDGILLIEGAGLYISVFDTERTVIAGNIHNVMSLDGDRR